VIETVGDTPSFRLSKKRLLSRIRTPLIPRASNYFLTVGLITYPLTLNLSSAFLLTSNSTPAHNILIFNAVIGDLFAENTFNKVLFASRHLAFSDRGCNGRPGDMGDGSPPAGSRGRAPVGIWGEASRSCRQCVILWLYKPYFCTPFACNWLVLTICIKNIFSAAD